MDGLEDDLRLVSIRTPADVKRAAIGIRTIAERIADFRVAPCHDIALSDLMVDADGEPLATSIFGWTEEGNDGWWCKPLLAHNSPIPTACRYVNDPFWCNEHGFRTFGPAPLLDQIDCSNFVRRGLTRAAIVVPVHLPFGQIGAVSFAPRDPEWTDLSDEFAKHGMRLGIIARQFLSTYVSTMREDTSLPVDPQLTRREVQCLRWAAVGKTDTEIGMIISRSRATVRFHMHNASLKLCTVNRSQTLYKAARLGFIGVAD